MFATVKKLKNIKLYRDKKKNSILEEITLKNYYNDKQKNIIGCKEKILFREGNKVLI
jgi:hypothetical protein